MKFLFLKILLLIFIFSSGLNVLPTREEAIKSPKIAIIKFFVNIIVAILMGIAVCMLP